MTDSITSDPAHARTIIHLALGSEDVVYPCPHCGSKHLRLLNNHAACYRIECETCGAEAHGYDVNSPKATMQDHIEAKASAIKAWNWRTRDEWSARIEDAAARVAVLWQSHFVSTLPLSSNLHAMAQSSGAEGFETALNALVESFSKAILVPDAPPSSSYTNIEALHLLAEAMHPNCRVDVSVRHSKSSDGKDEWDLRLFVNGKETDLFWAERALADKSTTHLEDAYRHFYESLRKKVEAQNVTLSEILRNAPPWKAE